MADSDSKPSDMDVEKRPGSASAAAAAATTTVVTVPPTAGPAAPPEHGSGGRTRRPARFWMVIVALSLLAFISSLDAMIMGTALPTITADLDGASVYVWIAN